MACRTTSCIGAASCLVTAACKELNIKESTYWPLLQMPLDCLTFIFSLLKWFNLPL